MSTVLSTNGLQKSFGSLVVTDDVNLTLPKGARHALIGPNGAGKTTLINLITGALAPDRGSVVMNEHDITALEPNQRVKRGLVRTFQINTLFPGLTPLEAVVLAVLERRGAAGRWWAPLAGQTEAVEVVVTIELPEWADMLGAKSSRGVTRSLRLGRGSRTGGTMSATSSRNSRNCWARRLRRIQVCACVRSRDRKNSASCSIRSPV